MRLLLSLAVALALSAPAAALASTSAAGDGTLALRNATGVFTIAGRGAVIGQVDRGKVSVFDPDPTDGDAHISGWDRAKGLGEPRTVYLGSGVNFRMLGGSFRLVVTGSGVDLSFVGRGTITIVSGGGGGISLGGGGGGGISLDGGDTYRPLPAGTTAFSFPPGP